MPNRFALEIERSIDYFRSTFGGEYIKHVLLAGGSARIYNLTKSLSEKLNVKTEIINPFLKIGYNKRKIDVKKLESIKTDCCNRYRFRLKENGRQMIKINLLPYREKKKKENLVQQICIIAGSFIVFILLLVWLQVWINSSISDLESQIKESEASLVDLDKKIGDLDKFKNDKKELEQKLGVIATLEENRLAPVKTLDNLAMLVPSKDIWLIKITQKGDSINIEGIGRDNIVVADFMKDIEKFDPIKSVDLISSKKTDISGITLQQFNFSCILKKGF